MKRLSLLACLLMAVFFISCHKDDCPPPDGYWQVQEVNRAGKLLFRYNEQRLLTAISQTPIGFGPNYHFTYDALKRPKVLRDSAFGFHDELFYQGGRLVRVSHRDPQGNQTAETFFSYDAKGRIVKKNGIANYYNYVTYEYEGNSRNFKRARFYNNPSSAKAGAAAENLPALIMEYTYDNKRSPFTTLLNTFGVIPLFNSEYMGYTFYDPIVPNNVLNQKFYGQVDTGYFKFMEYDYTYVYENEFPVSHTHKATYFNNDGTPGGTNSQPGSHTYYKLP